MYDCREETSEQRDERMRKDAIGTLADVVDTLARDRHRASEHSAHYEACEEPWCKGARDALAVLG